jgi:carboxyl-terminal processing protease
MDLERNKIKNMPSIQFFPKKNLKIVALVIIFLAGFWGGTIFEKVKKPAEEEGGLRPVINQEKNQPSPVDFSVFWNVWNTVHEKYVDKEKLDTQKMIYGAIEGMVGAVGDPFTNFLEPEVSKKFREEIDGSFSGVGIEIGIRDDQLTVISPIKDTPAFKAGVQAGDKIVKIDEKDSLGIDLGEAVSLIRGKRGTQVILTVSRNGLSSLKEISIIRDNIKIPTVSLEFLGENQNIAHLEVHTFNNNVNNDFRDAAKEILSSNADRIILDLRNNPGGLLDSSIYIASWFLNEGEVVTIEKFGDGKEIPFKAKDLGSLKHLPVVVLINKGSASASEILAGALKDNRNTQMIGEKTFGKGSVQELFELANKTSLKVTIAKWLTPNRTSINDNGIDPDIEIERTEEDINESRDPQLDKALEIVQSL